MRGRRVLVAAAVSAMGWCGGMARGALFTWTGGSTTSNNWSAAQNWTPSLPPSDLTADVRYNSANRPNPIVDNPWSINELRFSGATAYTIGGQTLTIDAGINHLGTATLIFNNTVSLMGTQTVNGAGTVIFNGVIADGGGPGNLLFDVENTVLLDGASPNTFARQINVQAGTAIFSKNAGVNAVGGNLVIGGGTGNAGDALVRLDADQQIPDASNINVNRTGIFNLNGRNETVTDLNLTGSVTSPGGTLTILDKLGFTGGTVNMGSGTLVLGGAVHCFSSTVTSSMDAAVIRLGQPNTTFDIADTAAPLEVEVNGLLANSAAGASQLRKENNGLLRLTAPGAYTGGTVVAGGVLQVDNFAGSATGSGDVTVLSGTRLEGNGAVAGLTLISANASLFPGVGGVGDIGTGTLILDAGARVQIQLQGDDRGTEFDAIDVAGNATINGQLTLAMVSGYVPAYGISHNILHATGARSGRFSSIVGVALSANRFLAVTYDNDDVFVTAALPGDANLSGRVDIDDFGAVAANFNLVGGWREGNFNGDSVTNIDDFGLLASNFNQSVPAAAARPVPEPAAAAACVLGLVRRRRRDRGDRA